jgi:hypothetical protein
VKEHSLLHDLNEKVSDGGVFDNVATQEFHSGCARMEVFGPDHPVLNGYNYIGVWLEGK